MPTLTILPLVTAYTAVANYITVMDLPVELFLIIAEYALSTGVENFLALTACCRAMRKFLYVLPQAYNHVYIPVDHGLRAYQRVFETFAENRILAGQISRVTVVGQNASEENMAVAVRGIYPKLDTRILNALMALFPKTTTLDLIGLMWARCPPRCRPEMDVAALGQILPPRVRVLNVRALEASCTGIRSFASGINSLPALEEMFVSSNHWGAPWLNTRVTPNYIPVADVSTLRLDLNFNVVVSPPPTFTALTVIPTYNNLHHLTVEGIRRRDAARVGIVLHASRKALVEFRLIVVSPPKGRRRYPAVMYVS